MSNVTDTQPVSQPLSDRLDRLTLEGRIAWHSDRAALDFQAHLLGAAAVAVAAVVSAVETRIAA